MKRRAFLRGSAGVVAGLCALGLPEQRRLTYGDVVDAQRVLYFKVPDELTAGAAVYPDGGFMIPDALVPEIMRIVTEAVDSRTLIRVAPMRLRPMGATTRW